MLARLTEIKLSTLTSQELGVAFDVSVLGSVFLMIVYGNVVDAYEAYHNLPKA